MQLSFSAGTLFAERSDVTVPTSQVGPQQFGVLQDIKLDFDWTNKPIFGQNIYPVAFARGESKISGTASFAQILGQIYHDILFGAVRNLGGTLDASVTEAQTIPATSPFQITVGNAASFIDDLGVRYGAVDNVISPSTIGGALSPSAFLRVSTAAGAGQYSVNFSTGIYTFSSADAGQPLVISYTFAATATHPQLQIPNPLMGTTPVFKMTMQNSFAGKRVTLRLDACTSSKFTFPARINEWVIQQLTFDAFADASGNVGYWTWSE